MAVVDSKKNMCGRAIPTVSANSWHMCDLVQMNRRFATQPRFKQCVSPLIYIAMVLLKEQKLNPSEGVYCCQTLMVPIIEGCIFDEDL